MPHPGREKGYDYSNAPYKVNWSPVQDRVWALKYVNPEGQDDQQGFEHELRSWAPYIFAGHSVPSWIPTVDYFLRHDRKGQRMDINYELARMPMPEEILEAQRKEREEKVRQQWKESREAHEEANANAPDPVSVELGRATGGEGGEIGSRMRERMAKKRQQQGQE